MVCNASSVSLHSNSIGTLASAHITADKAVQVLLKICLPDHTALKSREKELEAEFNHVHTRLVLNL